MARTRGITIGGKPLYQLSIDEIVGHASMPGRKRYADGIWGSKQGDYWRNQAVLDAFFEADRATTAQLVDAYHASEKSRDFSREFDAMRLGEHLGWAVENGIVRWQFGEWHLLHRDLQFELVGPANRQRAIRVRNAPPEQAEENAKLWAREQKRRERARLKRLGQHKSSIENWLNGILRTAADTPLEGPLQRFAFGDFQTIGAVAQIIIDSVDGMTLDEANEIDCYLGKVWIDRPADDRKRPPRVAPADDAVLSSLEL